MAVVRQVVRLRDEVRRRRQSSRRWLDRFYEHEHDPYHFDGNAYEHGKFDHLLGALQGRRYPRALEVGCAIGSFTERLAPHCDDLLAMTSCRPRSSARGSGCRRCRRCACSSAAPAQLPAGPFDLVVCSDVLYYLPLRRLRRTLGRLADSVAPGGSIVCLHWLGDLGAPTSGDTVHDELSATLATWRHVVQVQRSGVGPHGSGYRLDRFDRPT